MNRQNNIRLALERIERAAAQSTSKQPRFTDTNPSDVLGSIIQWVNRAEKDGVPDLAANSTVRDQWLRNFWRDEPHLAGVVSSVTFIDANRDWSLTGGRNQVRRFDGILRNAEDGQGWRVFLSKGALSYYATDLGNVVEIGRDGEGGPMRALYHVDSARCQLSGNAEFPLYYTPANGKRQKWTSDDYYRVSSMQSDDEKYNGLGFCAVSRCLTLAQLLVAIYTHNLEKLSQRIPQGLLLLKGIMQQQWEDASKSNQQEADAFERQYLNNVMVLASMGMEDVDAKIVPFSTLPEHFDLETATNIYMYGIALTFGYDPIEFWPVNAGALGRGKETEIQHRKSITKGAHAYTLGVQDRIQRHMPDTIMFEFEERDAEGEIIDAQLHKAWAEVANIMTGGQPILSIDEAKQYLAEKGIIPADWTTAEEDITTTAEGIERMKESLLDKMHIRRAIEQFPREPIIKLTSSGREIMLWREGHLALEAKRRYWITREIIYEDEDVEISDDDVDEATELGEERLGVDFAELLIAEIE